jgi:ABC-type Fe3+/spermidine/putrescine transport system ATPase subunit
VAKFIGKINTLPARAGERVADGLTLSIFGHSYRPACPGPVISASGEMKIYVRPEMIQLTSDLSSAHFHARIVERTFLGEKVEYGLEADGCSLWASTQTSAQQEKFALRQDVGVRLSADHLLLLEEETIQ